MGRLRWKGISAEERSRFAKEAVKARERKKLQQLEPLKTRKRWTNEELEQVLSAPFTNEYTVKLAAQFKCQPGAITAIRHWAVQPARLAAARFKAWRPAGWKEDGTSFLARIRAAAKKVGLDV